MLDQSLLQSHFIGRDGFRWWIGQIPPASSLGGQSEGKGWGNRFKVRIIGYHPYSEAELSNDDLPWAQCLVPTTAGTGAANVSTGVQLQPGDVVLGFFLDGDNAQIPVILAAFGRSSSVPSTDYKGAFQPFTGYDKIINKINPELQKNESNEQTGQPTPRDVSPEQIKKINPEEKVTNDAIGSRVILADPVGNTKIATIKSEVSNVLQKIKKYQNNAAKVREEIRKTVDTISAISNDFVGVGFNFLYEQLIPILKQGLKLLYDKVFAAVLAATGNIALAHLAGVAAQTAMVPAVKVLEESISKVANEIVKTGVTSIVTELLNSTVGNIDKFTSSVELQFSATLVNSVIDVIENGMQSPLGGVEKLLQFFPNFSVGNTLRSSINAIKSVGSAFDSNQSKESMQGLVTEWMVGANPIDVTTNSFQKILDAMNVQKSGSKSTVPVNVVDKNGTNLGSLYMTIKLTQSVTESETKFSFVDVTDLVEDSVISPVSDKSNELIKITQIDTVNNQLTVSRKFAGIATSYSLDQNFYVFSSNVKNSKTKNSFKTNDSLITRYAQTVSAIDTKPAKYAPPPTVKIFGGGRGKGAEAKPLMGNFVKDAEGFITGSIIGFEITNPGSGYTISPFIEIVDDIDNPQGYGSVARSVVKDGKLVAIYSVSDGENYTPNDNLDYYVTEIIIDNPGSNYGDITVTDQFDNDYPVEIFEGQIRLVQPINTPVRDRPTLIVNSNTGSGAVLRTVIGTLPIELNPEQKVVDCVT